MRFTLEYLCRIMHRVVIIHKNVINCKVSWFMDIALITNATILFNFIFPSIDDMVSHIRYHVARGHGISSAQHRFSPGSLTLIWFAVTSTDGINEPWTDPYREAG